MKPTPAEYSVVKKENAAEIHIRKLNFDVARYFSDFRVPEPITDEVLDSIVCNKGPEKPVILNDGNEFCVMTAKQIKDCPDCPHPCV